ncbi:MAG: hypothetical protein PW786_11975 [Arachidicoccus sp.]|nr:hypothetical protein [Arachidicoccus sp.]
MHPYYTYNGKKKKIDVNNIRNYIDRNTFTGDILFFNVNGYFIKGRVFKKGKVIKETEASNAASSSLMAVHSSLGKSIKLMETYDLEEGDCDPGFPDYADTANLPVVILDPELTNPSPPDYGPGGIPDPYDPYTPEGPDEPDTPPYDPDNQGDDHPGNGTGTSTPYNNIVNSIVNNLDSECLRNAVSYLENTPNLNSYISNLFRNTFQLSDKVYLTFFQQDTPPPIWRLYG